MVRFVSLFCLGLFAAAGVQAQAPRAPEPPGEIVGVGNFGHIVADMDKSLVLYRDILGLEVTR